MSLKRIIPRFDINSTTVQLESKLLEDLRVRGKNYAENGADELWYVDSELNAPDIHSLAAFTEELCDEIFMPIVIGGAFKDVQDIESILMAGADRVMVHSVAPPEMDVVQQISNQFGTQSIGLWLTSEDVSQENELLDIIQDTTLLGISELVVSASYGATLASLSAPSDLPIFLDLRKQPMSRAFTCLVGGESGSRIWFLLLKRGTRC